MALTHRRHQPHWYEMSELVAISEPVTKLSLLRSASRNSRDVSPEFQGWLTKSVMDRHEKRPVCVPVLAWPPLQPGDRSRALEFHQPQFPHLYHQRWARFLIFLLKF